jgi:predicted transcriptional regulator
MTVKKTYEQGFSEGYKKGLHSRGRELLTKNRKKILKAIFITPKTISQIRRELDLNYRTVWDHVQFLVRMKIVALTQNVKLAGKPQFVALKDKNIVT